MTKFLSLCLAAVMLCTLCVPAFADTNFAVNDNGDQYSETTVKYGVNTGYTVTIPDSVVFNAEGLGSATVSIANAILPSDGVLSVVLTGDSYTSDAWHLTDAAEESNKLQYSISNADNDTAFASGDEILSVIAGEIATGTKSQVLDFALTSDVTSAGTYNDTLTFEVNPIFKPSLAGTYALMGVRPTPETAINVDQAKFMQILQKVYGPDVDVATLGEDDIAYAAYVEYGVDVESTLILNIIVALYGVTPWVYMEYNGEMMYFCVGKGGIWLGDNTQSYYYQALAYTEDDLDRIYEDYNMTDVELMQLSFSIKQTPNVSDEIRNAFIASHLKFDENPWDYIQITCHTQSGSSSYYTHKQTWAEFVAIEGAETFVIQEGLVYNIEDGEPALVYFNGVPVQATDMLRPNTDIHTDKRWTEYGYSYTYYPPTN